MLDGICASIAFSPSGSMAPPFGSRTLKPLSAGGLWLAVMLTAPNAFACVTPNEMIGVGTPPPAEMHGNPVGGQHLCRGRRKVLGQEPLVPTDHHAAADLVRIGRLDVVREPLAAPPHVIERVVFGNAGPPTVSPKDNVTHATTPFDHLEKPVTSETGFSQKPGFLFYLSILGVWSPIACNVAMSASTMIRTRSRKVTLGSQPSTRFALLGSPTSRSTSAGR